MARGINKVILVGNLGQDPETRAMPSAALMLALSRHTPREILHERLHRLGIPLMFGILVIVPPQVWLERRFRGQKPPTAQVALVALDPHTGEVKALVGGRDYGISRLNHVTAKRQPGSAFKPFVYATAMNTALDTVGTSPVLTPISTVDDSPTTFWFDGKPYEPSNFKDQFYGPITLREALAQRGIERLYCHQAEAFGHVQAGRNVVIVTPTASGKTALALEIARHWPVDIISVDSALVYRGMDVGTAKPTAAQRRRLAAFSTKMRETSFQNPAVRDSSMSRIIARRPAP